MAYASPSSDTTVHVHGYGSLANWRTNPAVRNGQRAIMHGWRRAWAHDIKTQIGNVCALTIVPRADALVSGILFSVPREHLFGLDERERGYRRIQIQSLELEPPILLQQPISTAFAYTSPDGMSESHTHAFPIWRSYLECVLAGFLDVGGMPAVESFVASTVGWDTPLFDDSDDPKYPRYVRLERSVRNKVSEIIQGLSLRPFKER